MTRAISIELATFIGVRVAGQLTFIPAHNSNGKDVNARCIIPVYANSNKGTNQDGSPGRSDQFTIIAWGKLAEVCAVSCSPGKALDIIARPGSYIGTVYNPDGSPVLNAQAQVVQTRKTSFTVEKIVFGEESAKTIAQEIANGVRPINWQNPQHPDYQLWINRLRARQATKFAPGMAQFGYARVSAPRGGYQPPMNQGGYQSQMNQGGYQNQGAGGFQNQNRGGGFGGRNPNYTTHPRNDAAGMDNSGGFNTGYQDTGFQNQNRGGGYNPNAGGYQNQNGGGYNNTTAAGPLF